MTLFNIVSSIKQPPPIKKMFLSQALETVCVSCQNIFRIIKNFSMINSCLTKNTFLSTIGVIQKKYFWRQLVPCIFSKKIRINRTKHGNIVFRRGRFILPKNSVFRRQSLHNFLENLSKKEIMFQSFQKVIFLGNCSLKNFLSRVVPFLEYIVRNGKTKQINSHKKVYKI